MNNRIIICFGLAGLCVLGLSQAVLFHSGDLPEDYLAVTFSDWANLFGLAFLGVFLAVFLSQKSSMEMLQLQHLVSELSELVNRTEDLFERCQSYMKNEEGTSDRDVHMAFRRVAAKRSSVFAVIKKRFPSFDMKQLNQFNQHLDQLRDTVTGDAWSSRGYQKKRL